MVLKHPEKCSHVLAVVVDHFSTRAPVTPQKDPGHADKRLGIGFMRDNADALDQAFGQVALATDIGRHRLHGQNW